MGKIQDYFDGLNLRGKQAFRLHAVDSHGVPLCGMNAPEVKQMFLRDWLFDTEFRKCKSCERKYDQRVQLLDWRAE